ncbi:hypothetical protein UlMin_000639 [Ulmus minor]
MADRKNSNSGCFSGILRRMLCTGSAPTYPSEQIPDSNTSDVKSKPKEFDRKCSEAESEGKSCPGVVARLMGLDSLPDANRVPKNEIPVSVSRSRSVNFVDYLPNFDLGEAHHRRVRTSVSFREVPASFHQQNQDFLVVVLDNVNESETNGLEVRKSEMGFGEARQGKKEKSRRKERVSLNMKKKKKEEGRNKKISKLKNEPRREIVRNPSRKRVHNNGGVNQKKVARKFSKKRENQHADEKICKFFPENSSADQYTPKDSYGDELEVRPGKNKEVLDYLELAGQLWRLTEEDLRDETNWIAKNMNFEGFENICVDFERLILDMLLHQLIGEIMDISY